MDPKQREQMERTIAILALRHCGIDAKAKRMTEAHAKTLDALRSAYSAGQASILRPKK